VNDLYRIPRIVVDLSAGIAILEKRDLMPVNQHALWRVDSDPRSIHLAMSIRPKVTHREPDPRAFGQILRERQVNLLT